MADLYKYGTAVHLYKPIVKRGVVDFAVGADWTPAAGDVKISKDGGAAANVTNLPTAITMGNTALWDYSVTATEMQAAKVRITVSDSATKAVEDTAFEIDTYGNASAQHAVDFSDIVRLGLTALPNVASGSAGAIPTTGSGSNQINVTGGRADANVAAVNGTAANAPLLEGLVKGAILGTVSTANAAGDATHFRCSDITEATANHYLYKEVWVLSGTLAKQRLGVVTAYSLISGEGAFTVSPGSGSAETLANGTPVLIL